MEERVGHQTVDCTGCGTPLRRRTSDLSRLAMGRVFCGRDCPGGVRHKPRTGVELTCPQCGETFYRRPSQAAIKSGRQPCCSRSCAVRFKTGERKPGPTWITDQCEKCSKSFGHPRSQGRRRYCTTECAGVATTKIKLICEHCGGEYVGRRQEGRRFCGKACFYADQTSNAVGHITQDGYRTISVNGRQVPEHRIVMAEHLDRPLLPNESAHHRNGNKLDNRLVNLELWTSKQPKGQRVLDLMEYAREIIALYEPDELRLRDLEDAQAA